MRTNSQWNDVERLVLNATVDVSTPQQVADHAGLPLATAQAQFEVFHREGLLTRSTYATVRYQLTLTGRKRLSTLGDQPGNQAAA